MKALHASHHDRGGVSEDGPPLTRPGTEARAVAVHRSRELTDASLAKTLELSFPRVMLSFVSAAAAHSLRFSANTARMFGRLARPSIHAPRIGLRIA